MFDVHGGSKVLFPETPEEVDEQLSHQNAFYVSSNQLGVSSSFEIRWEEWRGNLFKVVLPAHEFK
jgi:hypothetical protein